MADGPSDATPTEGRAVRAAQAYEALARPERIAVVTALLIVGSMFLPWYGVPFTTDLVITGWGAFGFLEAALLLTLAATTGLVLARGLGRPIRPPFRIGTVIAGAGAWCIVLLAVRFADRPSVPLAGLDVEADQRYGLWLAVGAAALMLMAGLASRRVR